MKSPNPRKSRRRHRASRPVGVEQLETRTLFSFSIGGITIPGIPGLNLPTGVTLPALTNQLNLGSLSTYLSPPTSQWWLNNTDHPGAYINALNAWNISTGNANVVVAILDTGIDLQNAALANALWTNPGEIPDDGIDNDGNGQVDDVHGWNFLDNNSNLQDNFVHGTAVAASVLSVAPGISILPVEIGTSGGVNDTALVNGINYLINLKKAGVNIVAINASYISFTPPTSAEVNAIKAAGDNGMLYVAAAGNGGMNLDSMIPNIPSALAKYIPSFLPSNLIFVAATDNQDNLADFSDYGSHTVAVGAPGVDMTLPIPGGLYAPLSGTSFAAPMVSGIAALLKSKFPTATMSQIKDAILNSGDPDPALAGKTVTGRRVDAFRALNYMMGNKAPTGQVEVMNNSIISGWAFEPNLGSGAATVKITMDGTTIATVQASAERDDLADSLGSPNHGWSFDASSTPYGKHKFQVLVSDDTTGKLTLIGQGNLTVNQAPVGEIESADAKTIAGWSYDPDTLTKSDSVRILIDGKLATTVAASTSRPDLDIFPANPDSSVNVKHGFSAKLPTLKPGLHRVDAYAVDTLTGALTLIGTTEVSSNRAATGLVESLDPTGITGWAFDVDAGSTAIQVQYLIDDSAPVFVTANIARPDLQTQLGSKNHGFHIDLPQLPAGEHNITVYAIDPNTRQLVVLADQSLQVTAPDGNPLPTGDITITNTQVSGFVSEGDSTTDVPIRINIVSDKGTPLTLVATAVYNADSGQHTFTLALPPVAGIRRVDVFALDDQTSTPVLLNRQLINYTVATATVESFTSSGATGYAIGSLAPPGPPAPGFTPSAAGTALVRLDIDGLVGTPVSANLARPDLLGTLSRTNVGFNIPMPQLAPGDHTATLYLIDPTTLTATAIGELSFATA